MGRVNKKLNLSFSFTIIASLICHLLLASIFYFSFEEKFQKQSPYLASLGMILSKDEFLVSNNKNEKSPNVDFIKSNLPKLKPLDDHSNQTNLSKPQNLLHSKKNIKSTNKTIFHQKINPESTDNIEMEEEFKTESYKPLRLPK